MNEILMINKIIEVFSHRTKPLSYFKGGIESEYSDDDLNKFLSFSRYNISFDKWEKYYDTLYFFTAESFCYYLPSIMIMTIKEKRYNSMVLNTLLSPLDRSPEPEYWSESCCQFLSLTPDEISIFINFFLYTFEKINFAYNNQGDRIYDTLCIMQNFINRKQH